MEAHPHDRWCRPDVEGCTCSLRTSSPRFTEYVDLLDFLVKELTTGPCALCQKPGELRADSNKIMCQECYSLQWLTESHKNYPTEVPGTPMPHYAQPSFAAPFSSEPSSCSGCTLWEKVIVATGLDLGDARLLKERLAKEVP